ncbi:GNAT family N-acetyltransferase [Nocardiopsis sp. NPDC050513]|uniref:GNAT family N-acetyltransferase n=1 Tax=Nocardiopsis sp. NPDC050513 TaxID=3364338 RepID=UPI0037A32AA0
MSTEQRRPTIRPAAEADLAELQALARRTIDASYRGFLGDEGVDWFIGSGASDTYVRDELPKGGMYCLCEGDRIVGFSVLDGPTVDLMMVDSDHHRRGLGRRLLSHAEETLFARYSAIRLESFAGNTAANAFYEACGWSRGGELDGEGPAKVEYTKSAA